MFFGQKKRPIRPVDPNPADIGLVGKQKIDTYIRHHCDVYIRDFDYNQDVLSILAEKNIKSVQDYVNYGRENFDPSDNVSCILTAIQNSWTIPYCERITLPKRREILYFSTRAAYTSR